MVATKNLDKFIVLDKYTGSRSVSKYDLFCPTCYHEIKGILKGNILKRGCPFCNRIKKEQALIDHINTRIRELDPDSCISMFGKVDRSYYRYWCSNCKSEFSQKWNRKLKLNCPNCSYLYRPNVFQCYQRIIKKWPYYRLIEPEKYTSMNKPVLLKCTKCGTYLKETPRQASCSTCRVCSISNKKSLKTRKIEVSQYSRDSLFLIDMDDNGTGYFKCNRGHLFHRKISTMIVDKQECPLCNISSKGEDNIQKYLISRSIPYVTQKVFSTCKDKNTLPFDFYIDNKFLVEFDGIQHFKKVPFFNQKGDSLQKRVRRDNIKSQWAINNEIPLLRISYKDIDKVDDILKNKLDELGIKGGDPKVSADVNTIYPDYASYTYVINELSRKGVSIKEIAKEAYEAQTKFDNTLRLPEFELAVKDILHKREVLNACMVGLTLDKLATKGLLDEPLQEIISNDQAAFGIDEELAISICGLYGSIAITQFGSLDLNKKGLAKRLDSNSNGEVNTFIDDLVSALVACAEAKVMHHNAGVR